MDIVDRLRYIKRSHGAFGEPEDHHPSELQLEAAEVIEELRLKIHQLETAIWHVGGVDAQIH